MTTTKKPKTGGEIDAYCTKCRLDTIHRVVAMVDDVVKKVECKRCESQHLYRRPKTEHPAPSAPKPSTKRPPSAAARPEGDRLTAAQRAEREQTTAWESAIAGQPAAAFKAYRITQSFGVGELIRHPKFGDGVVSRVIDRGKIEILFKDGPRTMAQGQE